METVASLVSSTDLFCLITSSYFRTESIILHSRGTSTVLISSQITSRVAKLFCFALLLISETGTAETSAQAVCFLMRLFDSASG
jgi:hypothetical protein